MTELGTLGRYILLRRLAAGGMGEVYLAEAQGAANFTRKVAIKRILPHLAQDPDFVRKFIDEANLMVQLHHGNIVPLIELADHDGELYLVMEYLPGRDLKAVIRRLRRDGRRMPHDLAMWLVAEILAGLDYAHRKRDADGEPLHIVHRDVSPSNVCLGAGGEVKLVDFGIARARGGLHKSISGTLQGKFLYMSPEQADGRDLDARSDVFSAGLVLYELLTGVRPFEAETETAVLRKVREAVVPPPATLEPSVPAEVSELVMRALARDPDDRFQSATAMRRALSHSLADARSHADAATLSGYLSECFPEGVVPKGAPPGPLSLDAALQMQLGALTPSAPDRTRTHTGSGAALLAGLSTTGPERIALAPTATASVQTGPTAPVGGASHSGSFPVSGTYPPPARGRRRFLFLGTLLGVAASLVAVTATRPDPATLQIETQPPVERLRLTVDGSECLPDTRLPSGDSRQICVLAEGFQRACRYVTLAEGVNPITFALDRRPILRVVLDPPEAEAAIIVNDRRVTQLPFEGLPTGRPATVRIEPNPGWELGGYGTSMVQIEPGDNVVRFTLLRKATPTVDAAPPEVDAEPTATTSATPKRPVRPRRARIKIVAEPAAEITCDDATRGTTPMTVTASRRPVRCTISATGRVPRTLTIKPGDGDGVRRLTLDAYARLTARARPAAAAIYLDGRRLAVNLVRDHQVTPGRHVLEARLTRNGTVLRSPPVEVRLAPGEVVDEAILLEVPLSGGPP